MSLSTNNVGTGDIGIGLNVSEREEEMINANSLSENEKQELKKRVEELKRKLWEEEYELRNCKVSR